MFVVYFASLICLSLRNKGSVVATFISTPAFDNYFVPSNSISLQWTFDASLNPIALIFKKLDSSSGAYDLLAEHVYATKTTTVYWQPSRVDIYEQATLRINYTTKMDAGTYECELATPTGTFASTVNVWVRKILATSYDSDRMFSTSAQSLIRIRYASTKFLSRTEMLSSRGNESVSSITASVGRQDLSTKCRTQKYSDYDLGRTERHAKSVQDSSSRAFSTRYHLTTNMLIKPMPTNHVHSVYSNSQRCLNTIRPEQSTKSDINHRIALGLGLGIPFIVIFVLLIIFYMSRNKKRKTRHFSQLQPDGKNYHNATLHSTMMIHVKTKDTEE